jgi:16S rRNA (guanine966-N2)-methyltransferase
MSAKLSHRHGRDAKPGARKSATKLRIIGGKYRGRKLEFPAIEGLRPTADRVRETVFNWLAPVISGARCLDLFAGSGALSLEALSRGAAQATMLDQSRIVTEQLRKHLALLGAENAQLINGDALQWLERADARQTGPYDIVFLDPPFHSGLLAPCCELLEKCDLLHPNSLIYMEYETSLQPTLPPRWELHRADKAGQVTYALYRASGEAEC